MRYALFFTSSDFRLPTSLLPAPYSLLPVPCSLFPVPCSLWYRIKVKTKKTSALQLFPSYGRSIV
ncbi:hypothetical protein [Moorena producens]|uniref:hypothetical protein n=1 Tax=Moorena producens TaxID=1155739 RepID=UPI0011EA666E|nr:hypothetical protein [Moorena producens]